MKTDQLKRLKLQRLQSELHNGQAPKPNPYLHCEELNYYSPHITPLPIKPQTIPKKLIKYTTVLVVWILYAIGFTILSYLAAIATWW